MKSISALVLSFMLTTAGVAYAGVNVWTTHGPCGGHVEALAVAPRAPSTETLTPTASSALACVVGTGTAASCTESALDACLPGGARFNGTVTFGCGPNPMTITVSSIKTLSANTTIDGGSLVTLSGGGATRLFVVSSSASLANLTIAHGAVGAFEYGGAIVNAGGTLTVTNCTLSGNGAGYGYGGAIDNKGMLTVTNSTFSGNGAGYGGSIYNAGTLTLRNTIAANTIKSRNCFGGITDGGHNLDDGTSCGFSTAKGSLNNTDPKLDPAGLQNNGGPTQTIALQAGSPGINAGNETICAAAPVSDLDQRGHIRPGDGATSCSIGAYEYNSVPVSPTTCIGDCNNDGQVTIDELLTLVNIALGNADAAACPNGLPSGAAVDVALILQAVNNALNGCSR